MLVRDLRTGRLVMLGGNAASPRLGAYAPPRFGAGPPATAFYSPRLGYQSQWVRDERLGLPILAALPAIAAKVLPIVGSLLPMLTAKSESPPQAAHGSPSPTPQAQPAEKPSLLTTATTLLPQVASALTSLLPMPRAQTANAPAPGSPAEQTPTELTQQLPKEIQRAREHGDLRENAEYAAAKERQRFVEARISMLRHRVSQIQMINLEKVPRDRAGFGSKLKLRENGREFACELVMPEDADPDRGLVSVASPIGRSLVGKEVGDEVTAPTPGGVRTFEIVSLTTIHDEASDA